MLVQVTDRTWIEFKERLVADPGYRGAIIVTGPSSLVAKDAQLILERASHANRKLRYFLCSGSETFHVPCYATRAAQQVPASAPGPFEMLTKFHLFSSAYRNQAQNLAVCELEEMETVCEQATPLIVIECLTPLIECDLAFVQSALASPLRRKAALLFLMHQPDEMEETVSVQHEEELFPLYLLYSCGGRMREEEFVQAIRTSSRAASACLPIARRQAEDGIWLTYTSRNIAEWMDRRFQQLKKEDRRSLIRKIAQQVPACAIYPLLTIAGETGEFVTMLSIYSPDAVKACAQSSKAVITYFRRLRKAAKAAGDTSLFGSATINYLVILLFVQERNATRIYRCLRHAPLDGLAEELLSRLWFELGQSLARLKDPQAWGYASDCFERSRRYLDQIQALQQQPEKRNSRLAAIENGEALVAFKYQQGERARDLEETAFARLDFTGSGVEIEEQRILVKTNKADVLLRHYHNLDAALAEYEAAYTLALSCQTVGAVGYVVLRLVPALERKRRYAEGIQVLKRFLAQLYAHQIQVTSPMTVVRTLLTLAQLYIAQGNQRSAAACYWQVLRRPDYLAPALIRGLLSNLRACRPEIHERLQERITRIIGEQDTVMKEVSALAFYKRG